MKSNSGRLALGGLLLAAAMPALAQPPEGFSVHGQHVEAMEEVINEDVLEIKKLEKEGKLFPLLGKSLDKAAKPAIGDEFVVLGYVQSESQLAGTRWHAITHLATTFIDFEADGTLENLSSFQNRSPYLKRGGAAHAAGVKVVMALRNDDFSLTTIDTVMQDAGLRETLAQNVANAVINDDYCAGVNLDFEASPAWGTATRDGITDFIDRLRDKLPAEYELSVYTDPSYISTKWDIGAIADDIDYMNLSCYPWAGSWSSTVAAVTNPVGFLREAQDYIDAGLPPEKLVLTLGTYGWDWEVDTPGFGQPIDPDDADTAIGFTDGLFDTTLNPNNSGPQTNNYVTGQESGWYSYNDGVNRTAVWEDPRAMEFKLRQAVAIDDTNGSDEYDGRQVKGVGFWSLMWLAETSSIDPITGAGSAGVRTYPHVYQLTHEILSPPGTQRFLFEGFEGYNPRWADPNESPDTTGDSDNDTARGLVVCPAGDGAPESSTYAMGLSYDLESAGQVFFRHEVLNSPLAPTTTDYHSAIIHVEENSAFVAQLYTPAAHSGSQVRMILMDADGELEMSDPYTLNTSGWREIVWDLTDSGQINAYSTAEDQSLTAGAYLDGDGALDSAGSGERDIAFIGFLVETSGAQSGLVVFDELCYEKSYADGDQVLINEICYGSSGNADEYVELYAPAGSINVQLVAYDESDGTQLATYTVSGTVPNDTGTGFGYFVVGDPGVSNVDTTLGFTAGTDDLPDTDPSSIQIIDNVTGAVYDSAMYKAFGGPEELVRQETRGSTGEGYAWIGEIGPGTDSSGTPHVAGRYPDGADTDVNYNDFSLMKGTPGASNGGAITSNVTFDFSSTPTEAFLTYDSSGSGAVASGVGASSDGGNVYRVVDTNGGGVQAFFGDAALGEETLGYTVTGEIYIPGSTDPAQALGIGICASQGTVFFAGSHDAYGYENGFWLIYENRSGVSLNDGRADHGGTFEFVHATNDNMDGTAVDFLADATVGSTGASEGAWTTFELGIDPGNDLLTAKINNSIIYNGAIPEGGPISGAFVAGFRENHGGAPASNEGTWLDDIQITLNTGAPIVTVDELATYDTTPDITGTISTPNATISVDVGSQTGLSATNNGDGTWTLPGGSLSTLSGGTYNVTATATSTVNAQSASDDTTDELTVYDVPVGLVVYVDGFGATDAAGGPYSKLSLATAYVNANSNVLGNTIIVRTNQLEDDTQCLINEPVTIIGDGELTPDGAPCAILVDISTSTGIGGASDVGATNKNYIEIQTDGIVAISDLILYPNENGDTGNKLIDAIGMYKPSSGSGVYTLNDVWASASDSDGQYLDPATLGSIYSGPNRWYAYDNDRGIINLTDAGGGGSYDAILNNCRAGAARSHGLNIQNTSGSTSVVGGVFGWCGQDNIRISGTDVTITGTESNRVRVIGGSASSSGEGVRVLSGSQVDELSYIDAINQNNSASGLAFYGGTTTLVEYCRVLGSSGSDVYITSGATITDFQNTTIHRDGATGSPLTVTSSHSGTVNFTDCIFSSANLLQISVGGTGTVNFDYCAIPTDGLAESLNTTTPISGTPDSNTNSIAASPLYDSTFFIASDPANATFLRPTNTTDYTNASSAGTNLTGGAGGTALPVEIDLFHID